MMVVLVETIEPGRESGEVLGSKVYVVEAAEVALAAHARDPREGAMFRLTIVAKDAVVVGAQGVRRRGSS